VASDRPSEKLIEASSEPRARDPDRGMKSTTWEVQTLQRNCGKKKREIKDDVVRRRLRKRKPAKGNDQDHRLNRGEGKTRR